MSAARRRGRWFRTVVVMGSAGRLALGKKWSDRRMRGWSQIRNVEPKRCDRVRCSAIMTLWTDGTERWWICENDHETELPPRR